jgi:hypothetical protein
MMPGAWPEGKLDPSRKAALAGSAADIPAGGRDDRAALPDFVGAVPWRAAADDAAPVHGIRAAIAVPAIARCADEKDRLTLPPQAHSLPENRRVLSRRPTLSQKGLDNGTGFMAG